MRGRWDAGVSIVTTGAAGVGLASTRAPAAHGVRMIVSARLADRAAAAAEGLTAAGEQRVDGGDLAIGSRTRGVATAALSAGQARVS